MRAISSHDTAPMAMNISHSSRPNSMVSTITNGTNGTEYSTSTARIMSASVAPPV
jgi:hypothetical protein